MHQSGIQDAGWRPYSACSSQSAATRTPSGPFQRSSSDLTTAATSRVELSRRSTRSRRWLNVVPRQCCSTHYDYVAEAVLSCLEGWDLAMREKAFTAELRSRLAVLYVLGSRFFNSTASEPTCGTRWVIPNPLVCAPLLSVIHLTAPVPRVVVYVATFGALCMHTVEEHSVVLGGSHLQPEVAIQSALVLGPGSVPGSGLG